MSFRLQDGDNRVVVRDTAEPTGTGIGTEGLLSAVSGITLRQERGLEHPEIDTSGQ